MATKRIKQRRTRSSLSGPRYWMTVGTLAAYSAVGSGKTALAQEKISSNPGSKSGAQIQSLPVRRFDIPAGSLRDVLPGFEQVAQLHVEVSDPAALDVQSPGVSAFNYPQVVLPMRSRSQCL
ncbi:MAG: hypothetical protein JO182_03430 [Acidobacteriaceae bacterium]|nr:hypothetical protein [Acidobacteriaceae bacterium]